VARSDVSSMVLYVDLSCATRCASTSVNHLDSQSFFTVSSHLVLGLPLSRTPFTRLNTAMCGKRSCFLLVKWPKYISLLFSAFSMMSLLMLRILLMSSFLILARDVSSYVEDSLDVLVSDSVSSRNS